MIYRRHLRQSPQPRFIRALPLPASPLNLQLLTFNLPLFLPFRFPSSTFNRFLINVPFPKFFPCHTSENSPVSPGIATDPKTPFSKSCICHTSEPPGAGSQHSNRQPSNIQTIPQSIPFLFIFFRTLLHFFAFTKNSTLFFSSASALFAQNHPGGGESRITSRLLRLSSFQSKIPPRPEPLVDLVGTVNLLCPVLPSITGHRSRPTIPRPVVSCG